MNIWQKCLDTKDVVPLYRSHGLYLKPVALLHISVQLPQLKAHGKILSNWEIMDKLKQWIQPDKFISLKVSKSTVEFVRFDAEIESRSKLPRVISHLDGRSIKVSGFNEQLKVRAVESKGDFPSKHDWDSYFRDSKNMNEMKSGERPDTVYLSHLPCKWFSSGLGIDRPSERLIRNIFDQFGRVKQIDIPMLNPYRNQMSNSISGVRLFTFNKNVIFEVYVQYEEYFCFVKCMDAFRGMKLVYIDDSKTAFSASIKIDFDKTKHLSDASIRRRQIIQERLEKKEKERMENEMKEKEEENKRLEKERLKKIERRKQREEKRKQKQLEKLKLKEVEEMNKKIAAEEYLLLMAQRKLESIRLLGELFSRIENEKNKDSSIKHKARKRTRNTEEMVEESSTKKVKDDYAFSDTEKDLRYKLIQKFKRMQQKELLREEIKFRKSDGLEEKQDKSDALSLSSESETDVPSNRLRGRIVPCQNNNVRSWRPRRFQRDENNFNGNRYDRSYSTQNFNSRGRYRYPRRNFGWQSAYQNTWAQQQQYANQLMMPFVDPKLFLTYSQECYKYLKKMSRKLGRSARSTSRSYSRSTSSKSYSRSPRSRRSQSYSRSYSRDRSYTRSRSRSKSRLPSYSKSRTKTRSRSRSVPQHSDNRRNSIDKTVPNRETSHENPNEKAAEKNEPSVSGNISDVSKKSKDKLKKNKKEKKKKSNKKKKGKS